MQRNRCLQTGDRSLQSRLFSARPFVTIVVLILTLGWTERPIFHTENQGEEFDEVRTMFACDASARRMQE